MGGNEIDTGITENVRKENEVKKKRMENQKQYKISEKKIDEKENKIR